MDVAIVDEICALPNGARFFRADMHIHSFGGSPDVIDNSLIPEQIIDKAISQGLNIISITDHNDVSNVKIAMRMASGHNLYVLPGIELSTPEGHLLVYFKDLNSLVTFYGRVDIVDKETELSRCQTSMLECLKRVEPSVKRVFSKRCG